MTPTEAVTALASGVARLYVMNAVPADPTYPYGVQAAVLGGGDAYTLDSRAGLRHGLVSVQTFGRTANSATDLMEQVVSALLDRSLDVADWDCTPLRAGLDQPAITRDPDDDGVVTVTLPFTFTATKE